MRGRSLCAHAPGPVPVARRPAHSRSTCNASVSNRAVVAREGGGTASPHFFRLKFVQKFVHCCNSLLTETQCKIISVQQN